MVLPVRGDTGLQQRGLGREGEGDSARRLRPRCHDRGPVTSGLGRPLTYAEAFLAIYGEPLTGRPEHQPKKVRKTQKAVAA